MSSFCVTFLITTALACNLRCTSCILVYLQYTCTLRPPFCPQPRTACLASLKYLLMPASHAVQMTSQPSYAYLKCPSPYRDDTPHHLIHGCSLQVVPHTRRASDSSRVPQGDQSPDGHCTKCPSSEGPFLLRPQRPEASRLTALWLAAPRSTSGHGPSGRPRAHPPRGRAPSARTPASPPRPPSRSGACAGPVSSSTLLRKTPKKCP